MGESIGYQVTHHSFDKFITNLEREDMVQRDRGTLFELLVTAYLKKEPMSNKARVGNHLTLGRQQTGEVKSAKPGSKTEAHDL